MRGLVVLMTLMLATVACGTDERERTTPVTTASSPATPGAAFAEELVYACHGTPKWRGTLTRPIDPPTTWGRGRSTPASRWSWSASGRRQQTAAEPLGTCGPGSSQTPLRLSLDQPLASRDRRVVDASVHLERQPGEAFAAAPDVTSLVGEASQRPEYVKCPPPQPAYRHELRVDDGSVRNGEQLRVFEPGASRAFMLTLEILPQARVEELRVVVEPATGRAPGAVVRTVARWADLAAGRQTVTFSWDGTDDTGEPVAVGRYLLRAYAEVAETSETDGLCEPGPSGARSEVGSGLALLVVSAPTASASGEAARR